MEKEIKIVESAYHSLYEGNPERKLTKSDEENLKNCPPKKWFTEIDVWPKVKRAYYSLNRLVDAGKLEYRRNSQKSENQWRKIK